MVSFKFIDQSNYPKIRSAWKTPKKNIVAKKIILQKLALHYLNKISQEENFKEKKFCEYSISRTQSFALRKDLIFANLRRFEVIFPFFVLILISNQVPRRFIFREFQKLRN